MIRLIIDKLGSGHNDLMLKIDLMPTSLLVADSYYLFDFLEIGDSEHTTIAPENAIAYGAASLLNYWTDRINTIAVGEEKFIPFDLSDEYIGGLLFKKQKHLYKLQYVFTNNIHGHELNKSVLDKLITSRNIHFSTDKYNPARWQISEELLQKGLDWSKSELAV